MCIQTEENNNDDHTNAQFMRHPKSKLIHEKIAINLPINMHNEFKENNSRAANNISGVRGSNDNSLLMKKSYENLASQTHDNSM